MDALISSTRWMTLFWVPSNDAGVHQGKHGSNIFGVSNNLHFTELLAILRDPCP